MSTYYVEGPVDIRHPDRLFINGKWATTSSRAALSIVCPSTEGEIARIPGALREDIDAAVAAARSAFDHGPWPRLSFAERAALLRKIYDGIKRRSGEFSHLWTAEVGTPAAVSTFATTTGGGAHLAYYADLIDSRQLVDTTRRPDGGFACVVRESVGVTAAIIPWNAPLLLTTSKMAPALAMGGSIIVKSAPQTPLDALILAEIVEEAGIPPGVFNVVTADAEMSEYLASHPGVDKVAFTGSVGVGKRIASLCANRMARFTLELGGKSAAVVLDDISPADVIPSLVAGGTFLAGQACSGLTRILVSHRRYAEYVEALSEAYRALVIADPFSETAQIGPLALSHQRDRVENFVRQGLAEGAKISVGGGRPRGFDRGFYFEPTVFYGVHNGMRIAREEIFGPVATVIAYENVDEAINIANDSDYGLGGAVFTNDDDIAYRVARGMRTGNVTQNGWIFDPAFPFGGFKQSGIGREGGVEGLDAYSEVKTIYTPRVPDVGHAGYGSLVA
jgi:aldehyde dehydrogenase (NAD+)